MKRDARPLSEAEAGCRWPAPASGRAGPWQSHAEGFHCCLGVSHTTVTPRRHVGEVAGRGGPHLEVEGPA